MESGKKTYADEFYKITAVPGALLVPGSSVRFTEAGASKEDRNN